MTSTEATPSEATSTEPNSAEPAPSEDGPGLSTLSRSIAGRVAILTGAASGMGRATAELFADVGAKVLCVDRDPAVAEVVAGINRVVPGAAVVEQADLAVPEEASRLVAVANQVLGPVDILINNAGVSMPSLLDQDDFEDVWRTTFAVNTDAQMRLVRAALDDLRRNGDGRVVNIASTEGLGATPRLAAYTASKHAVIGLTRSLAVDLGASGVTVNCVCPGPIRTGMTDAIPEEAKTIYAKRRVPLRRYGAPEEVAHITLSLVLPASSFITGAIVPVDGGLSTKFA